MVSNLGALLKIRARIYENRCGENFPTLWPTIMKTIRDGVRPNSRAGTNKVWDVG